MSSSVDRQLQKTAPRILLGLMLTVSFFAAPAKAQLGADWFNKPAIADIFKPVVGSGGEYRRAHQQKSDTMEMTVVGKETVDGKVGYWLEVGHSDPRAGGMSYAKMLVTQEDFQFHRMVIEMNGRVMEMPMNINNMHKSRTNEEMAKWHKVGTESITVPAGTFSCDHWTKTGGGGDVWVSSKVSPMGMVKEVSPTSTMTLVRVITDAKDHITGTPQKFDPRQMMQQMQKK